MDLPALLNSNVQLLTTNTSGWPYCPISFILLSIFLNLYSLFNFSSSFTSCLQTVEKEEGLGQVLQQMGVQSGQNISFENFWTLINKQAIQRFGATHKEKNVNCGCMLQWNLQHACNHLHVLEPAHLPEFSGFTTGGYRRARFSQEERDFKYCVSIKIQPAMCETVAVWL